jgi:lysozyme
VSKVKIAVASLILSAAGFIGIIQEEGYTDNAIIPTKGDVPTLGFGSTKHIDGSAVKMGQSTNPVNALKIAKAHIDKDEAIFRASLPGVSMTQDEYDMWMSFVYQFGTGNWGKSGMRRNLLIGESLKACDVLLEYRFVNKFDCSTPGNKICMGVWTRQLKRHQKCLNATQVDS